MPSERHPQSPEGVGPVIVSTQSYQGYVFTISHDPFEPGYTVDFPDIPQIITSADLLPGAFANACEALDLYLETLEGQGRPLPPSRHRLVMQTA